MSDHPSGEVTALLNAWGSGDRAALDKLVPIVHGELHRIARIYMLRERPDHTLQATGLVNEAYLHLAKGNNMSWRDRNHFLLGCAQIMRRILVNAARARNSAKRLGKRTRVYGSDDLMIEELPDVRATRSEALVAAADALAELEQMDPRKAQVVELRFFGGLTVEETAKVLDIHPQTVKRDWTLSKAWLMVELKKHGYS